MTNQSIVLLLSVSTGIVCHLHAFTRRCNCTPRNFRSSISSLHASIHNCAKVKQINRPISCYCQHVSAIQYSAVFHAVWCANSRERGAADIKPKECQNLGECQATNCPQTFLQCLLHSETHCMPSISLEGLEPVFIKSHFLGCFDVLFKETCWCGGGGGSF